MQFFLVVLLNLIASSCMSIVIPIMPVILQDHNFNASGLSLPFFAIVFGRILSRTFCVNIVGKFQYKVAIMVAFAIYTIVFALYIFINGKWGLIGLRLFEGLVEGLVMVALTDIVLMLSTHENRGFHMGIFGASFGVGAVFGSFYAGWVLEKFGINAVFVSNIIFALCGAWASGFLKEYHLVKEEKLKLTKELLHILALYSASVLRRVYMFSFAIFLPIYCVQVLDMSLRDVANVFAMISGILILVGPVAGRLADKTNTNVVIIVCIVMMSFTSLMIFFGLNFKVFFGLMLVFFGITMPANMKVFCDAIEHHPNRTQVLGLAGSSAEFAMLFVAMLVPFVISFGVRYAWLFLVMCGAFTVIPYLLQKQKV
jgi:MFS family permease